MDPHQVETEFKSEHLVGYVAGTSSRICTEYWNMLLPTSEIGVSHATKRSFLHEIFKDQPAVSQASVRDSVMQMYINLPQCFKRPIRHL